MYFSTPLLFSLLLIFSSLPTSAFSEQLSSGGSVQVEEGLIELSVPREPSGEVVDFQAFTGTVNRQKVRVRLQPNLDCPVIRELNKGDFVSVLGEIEDFYAIRPPEDIKGYVYRTFVLDGVVEGDRVNVRLEPSLEGSVVAQLHAGDHVFGKPAFLNGKWLEIDLPEVARFFICKDYVDRAGDAAFLGQMQKRREEVNRLLGEAYVSGQKELHKPFPEIEIEPVLALYRTIIAQYADFPDQVGRAKELLASSQDEYLHKKISYLEEQEKIKGNVWHERALELGNALKEKEQEVQQLQGELETVFPKGVEILSSVFSSPSTVTAKMKPWLVVEQGYYEQWCQERGDSLSLEDFYEQEAGRGESFYGLVEPYQKQLKNKPGDYLLFNGAHRPIAYLYSTKINLEEYVGCQVHLKVVARPNRQFALPAYFVLEASP